MVIEWLKFYVASRSKQKFIEQDQEIWTSFLATRPGFLGKEIWLNPNSETEIIFVIYWKTREQWKSIPKDLLEETEARFAQAVGKNNYRIEESLEYQVRKFRENNT